MTILYNRRFFLYRIDAETIALSSLLLSKLVFPVSTIAMEDSTMALPSLLPRKTLKGFSGVAMEFVDRGKKA
jgi:hypothetical protein